MVSWLLGSAHPFKTAIPRGVPQALLVQLQQFLPQLGDTSSYYITITTLRHRKQLG